MKWKWKSSIFDVLIYPTNVYDKSHTCSGWATTSKAALPLGIWLVLKMYFPNNLACKKGTLPKLHSDICLVLNIQNQLVALKSSLKDCLFLHTSAPLLQTYTHQFKHALKSTNTFLVWLVTFFIRAYLFFRLRPQFDLSFTENYFKSNTDSNVVIYQLFWSAGFFLSLLPVRVLIKQKYPSGFLLKKCCKMDISVSFTLCFGVMKRTLCLCTLVDLHISDVFAFCNNLWHEAPPTVENCSRGF